MLALIRRAGEMLPACHFGRSTLATSDPYRDLFPTPERLLGLVPVLGHVPARGIE